MSENRTTAADTVTTLFLLGKADFLVNTGIPFGLVLQNVNVCNRAYPVILRWLKWCPWIIRSQPPIVMLILSEWDFRHALRLVKCKLESFPKLNTNFKTKRIGTLPLRYLKLRAVFMIKMTLVPPIFLQSLSFFLRYLHLKGYYSTHIFSTNSMLT